MSCIKTFVRSEEIHGGMIISVKLLGQQDNERTR